MELDEILNEFKHAVQRKSASGYREVEQALTEWRDREVATARREEAIWWHDNGHKKHKVLDERIAALDPTKESQDE